MAVGSNLFGARRGRGARQQAEVVVDQLPVLPRRQKRAERPHGRTGAAGEIDDPDREERLESGGDGIENGRVARPQIVGFAQCQPVGGEAAHASVSSSARRISADCRQVGSCGAAARAPPIRRRRRSLSPMTRRSASASAGMSPGGTSRPAFRRHRFRYGAASRADDGQAVRDRFGIGHAVAFEMRGEHEHVGFRIERREALRRHRAEHGNAIFQPVSGRYRHRAARRHSRSRVRSPAIVSRHGRSASVASAAISTSKPLRGTTAPTDSSRTTPSRLPGANGAGSLPGLATVMRSAGTP